MAYVDIYFMTPFFICCYIKFVGLFQASTFISKCLFDYSHASYLCCSELMYFCSQFKKKVKELYAIFMSSASVRPFLYCVLSIQYYFHSCGLCASGTFS